MQSPMDMNDQTIDDPIICSKTIATIITDVAQKEGRTTLAVALGEILHTHHIKSTSRRIRSNFTNALAYTRDQNPC